MLIACAPSGNREYLALRYNVGNVVTTSIPNASKFNTIFTYQVSQLRTVRSDTARWFGTMKIEPMDAAMDNP